MKLKPLILFLFASTSLMAQDQFNWNDKEFKTGEKKRVFVEYLFGKKAIRDTIHSSLDTLVLFLKKNNYLKVEVNYCGYENLNSSAGLLQGRASNVTGYLMAKGIDTARIIAKGWNVGLHLSQDSARKADRYTEVVITSACYKHEIFNYNDSAFYVGSRRIVKVKYYLDGGNPLMEESNVIVDSIGMFMRKHPTLKIEIAAYTDPRGSAEHNIALSHYRAQGVVWYLIGKGIDSARILAKGYGLTKPLPGCSAKDIALMKTQQEKEAAWRNDRRTEVVILEK